MAESVIARCCGWRSNGQSQIATSLGIVEDSNLGNSGIFDSLVADSPASVVVLLVIGITKSAWPCMAVTHAKSLPAPGASSGLGPAEGARRYIRAAQERR